MENLSNLIDPIDIADESEELINIDRPIEVEDELEELRNLIVPVDITAEVKERSIVTKEEWKEWTKTVWSIANVSDSDHRATFPIEIPYRLIRMYSYYGETVLDPFSGMANTGKAALKCGRNYVGFETNPEYQQISSRRLEAYNASENVIQDDKFFRILNRSSLDMNMIPENSIGTIVTSPPYWDKADYGDYDGNIGNMHFYDDFLTNVQQVLRECYRVLMPGRKLSIVTANVNQNTYEHGLLTFPIAADLIKKAQEIGYVLINEVIWSKDGTGGKWGSYGNQRPIFGSYPYPPNFLFKNIHEYVIILKKPDIKSKSSAAPKYDTLFREV
ncbi:MAG: Methyltransferase protein [Clostridia bacterium]|jgi:site-specific DNA-methyltransferase (adenine-specific)|nr:Methyltransferase protein [Clostridia bacterium]